MFKTKAQTRQRCSDGVNKTLCKLGSLVLVLETLGLWDPNPWTHKVG